MLDMSTIREEPDRVRQAVRNKGEKAEVDAILKADEERRQLLKEVEALKRERNVASEAIGGLKRGGKDASAEIARMQTVAARIKELDRQVREADSQLRELLQWVPNLPAEGVPVGSDDESNVTVREWGEVRSFYFEPKPHWELGTALGLVDFKRGAKLAGEGFLLLTGPGARLQRALVNFMLELHTTEHGYLECSPPHVSNRDCMFGTGQLPKLEADMYHLARDDFFLIPTGEVPLTGVYRQEILPAERLPLCLTATTACYRREAGAAGKDTRGMIRIHQFEKVELVRLVHPDRSFEELELLLSHAEAVLRKLGLPYRVRKLCTGELSFAGAMTYDLEAYAPGLDQWLEVSSVSLFTDFQARRLGVRFRGEDRKVRFVHTLNGSALALPRTFICLVEHCQRSDGSVALPAVLQPYLGGLEQLSPPAR